MCVCMYVCAHVVYMYVCVQALYMYIYIYICMYVCMYVRVYHVYVCMYSSSLHSKHTSLSYESSAVKHQFLSFGLWIGFRASLN